MCVWRAITFHSVTKVPTNPTTMCHHNTLLVIITQLVLTKLRSEWWSVVHCPIQHLYCSMWLKIFNVFFFFCISYIFRMHHTSFFGTTTFNVFGPFPLATAFCSGSCQTPFTDISDVIAIYSIHSVCLCVPIFFLFCLFKFSMRIHKVLVFGVMPKL